MNWQRAATQIPLIAKNAEVLKGQAIAGINKTLAILDSVKPAQPTSAPLAADEAIGGPPVEQAVVYPSGPSSKPADAVAAVAPGTPAPPSAGQHHLPCEEDAAEDEKTGPGEGAYEGQAEAVLPSDPCPGVGFVVPASSTPAGKGSEIRIYRDENGKIIPAHRLDRRKVARKSSDLPKLSEVAEEYFDARAMASNADLKFKPLKRSAFEDGYVSIAKTVIGSKATDYQYENPLAGIKLRYPDTAAPATSAEPLSHEQLNKVFRAGIVGGLLDEAVLPLLGNLTGRRLGLLTHLTGNDIRQKYPGVWVAQTSGIVLTEEGLWKRVPIKTDQSTTFFVLHDLLREIGFIEWAQAREESFLFPTLTGLKDPSKQASTYMQRLFRKAGIPGNRREVFHSLRGGHIELMRDNKVDARDRRLQAGHKIEEEHDLYGFKAISEERAREIAHAKLKDEVDYSVFRELDFEELSGARRTRGRRPRNSFA